MRSWILSACCILCASQPVTVVQEKLSPQEAFFLRRVTEFWKDRDYVLVKKQIDEFLSSHEASNIHNNLYALLGDIYYQESNYQGALATYNKISDPALIERSACRKAQCLYLAGNYDEVVQILASMFEHSEKIDHQDEMQFIFADSLFRKMRATVGIDAQKSLALQAKPLLLALYNTTYQDKVLLPLAEIHRELKEPKEGAPLYLMLAEKMPIQKEELLLQAAALQMEFDPLQALPTFEQVVDLGGSKASEAAYQELLLLFQNDLFSNLISRSPRIEMHLDVDKKTLFEFCLARSHFKLDQIPEAILHYNRFIEKETESTPHKRAAYLTLIHCAQKTDSSSLFDQVLVQFLKDFPSDEEAGKALLLHAQVSLQKGDVGQASRDLDQLLRDFPDFPDQETLLYDQALLLSKTQQWERSRSAFISYLGKFPSTSRSNQIWTSIVHSSVQELKGATEENLVYKKEQLASDLTQALAMSNLFSSDEEAAYQFLLGQLIFDLNRFSESAAKLDDFCQKYPEHPSVAEAYLLQALSHYQLKSEPELFIPAAEKALSRADDFTHKTALRLHLFNAYLSVKQFDKAAENLYQTFIVDGTAVQPENQLWLAGYYKDKDDHVKAVEIFKKALAVDDDYNVNFDPALTYLEGETLKFAGLLDLSQKEKVLRSLVALQGRHHALPWKHQDTTLLELGQTCMNLQRSGEALATFEALIAKEDQVSPLIRNTALLEKARILLSECADRSEDSPTLRLVLSTLKDLQIQKQISQEPIHLEAALDYADLRTSLSPEVARSESALFFLNRVKEDFNAKDDPISQEYHEARLRYPEKDIIFQNYMKCLEAELLCWEAKLALQNNDNEKAEHSKQVAITLFEEVRNEPQATSYLKHRVEDRLNELR
ncbi:MAG: tetratricopeptide repeat protein [Rhabdochlamydiaceae bacterium]